MPFASRCIACNNPIDSEAIGLCTGEPMDVCGRCSRMIHSAVFAENEPEPGFAPRKPSMVNFRILGSGFKDEGNYRSRALPESDNV